MLQRHSSRFMIWVTLLLSLCFFAALAHLAFVPSIVGQEELKIYLKAGTIDSSYQEELEINSPYNNLPPTPLPSGELLYLVQFDGPILTAWHLDLVQTGAEVSGYYVPNFSFLVRMHPDSVEIVRSLPHVYSVLLYKPVYKIESGLIFGEGFIELNVNAFSASDISELSSDIVSWGGSITELTWSSSRLALLQVNLPVDSIENLISSSRVVYIDAYRLPLPLMADTQWVNQGYVRNATPIWDRGLSGEGEVIAVQEAECFSCNPPILYEFEDRSCFFAQPNDKVTFFGTAPLPCSYSGTGASSGCYHRTGVLAAAVGDAPPYLSPNSSTTYDALAYGSKTILASLANSDIFTFLDSAIVQGSRLGNFSYGGCGTMPMGCADGVYGTSGSSIK